MVVDRFGPRWVQLDTGPAHAPDVRQARESQKRLSPDRVRTPALRTASSLPPIPPPNTNQKPSSLHTWKYTAPPETTRSKPRSTRLRRALPPSEADTGESNATPRCNSPAPSPVAVVLPLCAFRRTAQTRRCSPSLQSANRFAQ